MPHQVSSVRVKVSRSGYCCAARFWNDESCCSFCVKILPRDNLCISLSHHEYLWHATHLCLHQNNLFGYVGLPWHPAVLPRQRLWKVFTLRCWWEYVVQDSLPWNSVLVTQACWYAVTSVFEAVFIVGIFGMGPRAPAPSKMGSSDLKNGALV